MKKAAWIPIIILCLRRRVSRLRPLGRSDRPRPPTRKTYYRDYGSDISRDFSMTTWRLTGRGSIIRATAMSGSRAICPTAGGPTPTADGYGAITAGPGFRAMNGAGSPSITGAGASIVPHGLVLGPRYRSGDRPGWRGGPATPMRAGRPLPPGAEFVLGVGLRSSGFDIPPYYWIFVDGRHFWEDRLDRYCPPVRAEHDDHQLHSRSTSTSGPGATGSITRASTRTRPGG